MRGNCSPLWPSAKRRTRQHLSSILQTNILSEKTAEWQSACVTEHFSFCFFPFWSNLNWCTLNNERNNRSWLVLFPGLLSLKQLRLKAVNFHPLTQTQPGSAWQIVSSWWSSSITLVTQYRTLKWVENQRLITYISVTVEMAQHPIMWLNYQQQSEKGSDPNGILPSK